MMQLYYSAPIVAPKNKREGLANFVQMIINQIEKGEPREALLLAVDLRGDLISKASPYAEVIDEIDRPALNAMLIAQAEAAAEAKADYGRKMYAAGKAEARAEMLKLLGGNN